MATNRGQRDASENGKIPSPPGFHDSSSASVNVSEGHGTSTTGTANTRASHNHNSTEVRLEAVERMAVHNLLSSYPSAESSFLPLDSGAMSSSLSTNSSLGGLLSPTVDPAATTHYEGDCPKMVSSGA